MKLIASSRTLLMLLCLLLGTSFAWGDPSASHTVTFYVNGQVSAPVENVEEGEQIRFPDDPSIADVEFMGWTKTAEYYDATTAPSDICRSGVMGNADVNYYAVFAKLVSEGSKDVIDVLTLETTGVANIGQYESWQGKKCSSEAVYAGYSAGYSDGANNTIQLHKDRPSGIVTTHSGGKVKKVEVEWYWPAQSDNIKTLEVYGSNKAYTTVGDLYDSKTKGTVLGRIERGTSTELEISDDYEYIGFRAIGQSLNLIKLSITWGGAPAVYSDYSTTVSEPQPETGAINFVAKADDGKYYATFSNERAVRFKDSFVNTDETCHAQITAYTVTVSEGQITKTGLNSDNNNYIYIPANTGVLLEYSQEENREPEGAVPFEYADAEEVNLTPIGDNMLVPCTKDGIYNDTDTDNLYYKLAYGDNVNKTNLGFYWGAADGSGNFKVRKGIAILRVPKSVATIPTMSFIFDIHGDVNAIEAVENMDSSDVIYNLQGVRLNRIQKGVNIVNGRKVIR